MDAMLRILYGGRWLMVALAHDETCGEDVVIEASLFPHTWFGSGASQVILHRKRARDMNLEMKIWTRKWVFC